MASKDTTKTGGDRGSVVVVSTGREREKGFQSGSKESFDTDRMKGDVRSVAHSISDGKVKKW